MPDPIDTQRRRLLGTTSALAGASLLSLGLNARAQAQAAPAAPSTTTPSAAPFAGMRQIRAGELEDPQIYGDDIVVVERSGVRSAYKSLVDGLRGLVGFSAL